MIRREDLGLLLAASLAVLGHLTQDHPSNERTWALAQSVTAAEQALLGEAE